MNKFSSTLLAVAVLAALPLAANAESNYSTGAGALTASAKLDFQVVVPKVLSLRVGTGANFTTNAAIDMITFTVPAANVGNSTAVAGTGGTTGASGVTASLVGNGGNITLKADTVGAMNNGAAAETISFGQISTASNNASLPAPILVDGAATAASSVTVNATNKVVNQSATWTYSYANSVTPAAGTYGGAGVNNGRVTYTASMP